MKAEAFSQTGPKQERD